MAGALNVSCILDGAPAFMAEVGGGGRFEEENIAVAEKGIWNVMRHLGMIRGEIELPRSQIVITRRRFFYAKQAGFWVAEKKAGAILPKGQIIGRVIDLFSDVEVIKAEQNIFLIQVRGNPVVHSGDRIAFLGLEWKQF